MGSRQEKETVCDHAGQWPLPGPWGVLGGQRALCPDVPFMVKAAASGRLSWKWPLCAGSLAELYSEEWTAWALEEGWDRGTHKAVGMATGG